MKEFVGLLLYGCHNLWVAVTGTAHRYAGSEIEKSIAIRVIDPEPLSRLSHQRIDSGVGGRYELAVNLNESLDSGTG